MLAHRGTRVARSTGAALVVDWGVSLRCRDRRSRLHVLIINKQGIYMAARIFFFFTCHNVSDGFDEGSKGRDVRLAVLPHWLPYYQAAGQSEGQVRLLKKKINKNEKVTLRTSFIEEAVFAHSALLIYPAIIQTKQEATRMMY